MHIRELLGAAVANNASWCDAVCQAHGYPGAFSSRLWTSTRHCLPFYPNVITLSPRVTVSEVPPAPPSRPFAVKDSFARLDLAPSGFRPLIEASWIVRTAAPDSPADDGLGWETITSPGELSAWESAWAGGGDPGGGDPGSPLFQSALLSDPRCAILACRRQGTIIAGAIVYAADGVAGISNLFSTGLPAGLLWASLPPAVAGLRPGLPVVGYEDGTSLETAQQAGFRVLGSLRIWASPAASSPGP